MNIMLLSDIPPCKNYTAGIVENIMIDFLLEAGHSVCCFVVKNKDVDPIFPKDKLETVKTKTVDKPRENWGHHRFSKTVSRVGECYVNTFQLPEIRREAVDFAKKNQVDLIWGIAQGQTMIKLIQPVAKGIGKPYTVQIWDPPSWWFSENKVDQKTQKKVLDEYAKMIHNSQCCIAASWAMAEKYSELYKPKECIPVILGFQEPDLSEVKRKSRDSDTFVIALTGQMYSITEIYVLIDALHVLNWEYNGKKIILRFYGRQIVLHFVQPAQVESRGWMEQDEMIRELASETDLLYCPYWFSPEYEDPARLSFPSKLSTYLTTHVPVLFHGPDYASPRKFLEKHHGAYIYGKQNPYEMAQFLKAVIDDPTREQVGETGYYAFTQNLTLDKMRDNFFRALGLQ